MLQFLSIKCYQVLYIQKNCKNHLLVQLVLFKIDFIELNLKIKKYYNENNSNIFLNDFLKYGQSTLNITTIQTHFNKYLKTMDSP